MCLCMHACMHALHYITLHYITLHYITSHHITLHYITLHTYITYMHACMHAYIHTYIYSWGGLPIISTTCVSKKKQPSGSPAKAPRCQYLYLGLTHLTDLSPVLVNLGIHQRGVQSEGGAVDGGSII